MTRKLNKLERNILIGAIAICSIPIFGAVFNVTFAKGFSYFAQEGKSSSSPPPAPAAKKEVPKPQKFNMSALPDYCFPEYQRLTLDTFNLCIQKGMSYVQVANVIGNKGNINAVSGSVKNYSWGETGTLSPDGGMSATFINDRLVSKAQYSLDNCEPGDCRY